MTADPRVEAVAAVLRRDGWTCDYHEPVDDPGECPDCDEGHASTAGRIVAALDAYDRKHPIFADATHYAAVETDLRERIALDLTSCACSKCEAAGRRLRSNGHAACGYWLSAARIARGGA